VNAAFRGQPVTRQWAAMELNQKGKPAKVNLRVSCQPFSYGNIAFNNNIGRLCRQKGLGWRRWAGLGGDGF